jgi:hypothetical protein
MAKSNGAFTLTITSSSVTGTFGEATHSENAEIARCLYQVAQDVQSGRPSAAIRDRMGNVVGSYSYGVGMLSAGR